MDNATYPQAVVEEIKAAAAKLIDFFGVAASVNDIMRMAFPDYDPRRIGADRMKLGEFVADQLTARGLPPLAAEMIHFLNGPIICHNEGGWGPDWQGHPVRNKAFKRQIREERIEIALGIAPFPIGPTEFMCVAYAAVVGMGHGINGPLGELWIWAAAHAMGRTTGQGLLHVMNMLEVQGRHDSPRHLTDAEVTRLEPYKSILATLAADIRRKVIGCEMKRVRSAKQAAKAAAKEAAAAPPDLFGA
jgi:hypothetical protein